MSSNTIPSESPEPSATRAAPPTSTPASPWRSRLLAGLVFTIALGTYQLNGKALPGGDTVPLRYLPLALLCQQNTQLDRFGFAYRRRNGRLALPYYLVQGKDRHLYSTFGPMPALMALPIYAVAALWSREFSYQRVLRLGKWSASLMLALAALLLYLAMLRSIGDYGAFVLALTWALGTSAWSMFSQGLWQSSAAAPWLAAALLCLVRGREIPRWLPWAALCFGMATLCRPTNGWIALSFTLYIFLHHRAQLWRFLLYASLPACLLLTYNLSVFGNPLMFGQIIASKGVSVYKHQQGQLFQLSAIGGRLLGIMWSPSRGVFTYSPVLLFGAWGLLASLHPKHKQRPLFRYALLATAGIFLLHSMWFDWWGGWSYGYRLPFDSALFLVFGTSLLWPQITRSSWKKWTFAAALCFSIWVQALGAFSYDLVSWNARPNVDHHPQRLWSLKDSQLLYYLQHPRWLGPLPGHDSPKRTLSICPVNVPGRTSGVRSRVPSHK